MADRESSVDTEPAGPSQGHAQPRSSDSRARRNDHRWRSPLGIGTAISAVLHVIALVLYSFTGAPDVQEVSLSVPESAGSTVSGTEIVNIVAVEGDVAAPIQPDPELEEVESDVPAPESDPGPVDAPVDVEFERLRTAAEILQPHAEDSILLREVDAAIASLTDSERAQLRMNWMVNEWNELEESERRAKEEALDWTHTDEDGNKWGISPGKIHLGALTLPLPALGRTQGVDPAEDRLQRDLAEIEDQAARGLVWQNWQRRAAEIRKRKDRERAQRLGGERVDTTGVRR